MLRSGLLFRSTALVLSWAVTATSAWAVDPSLGVPAPSSEPPGPVRTVRAGLHASDSTAVHVHAHERGGASGRDGAPSVGRARGNNSAGGAVRPILECVVQNSPTSYTAHFSYKNDNDVPVTIAVGTNNKFTPTPVNRGQPSLFQPGRTPFYPNAAFQVPFNGSNLVWTLKGPDGAARTSTASSGSKRCALDTTPPVLTLIEPKPDAIVKPPVALWLIYQDNQALNLTSLSVKIDTRPVAGLTVEADKATGTAGPLTDGLHTLDAEIRDQAGNPARVKAVFTVDGTAPQLDITEPLDGQVVTGTSITVAGQVHDVHATTVMVENVPALVDCHGATGGTCAFRAENVPLGDGPQVTLHVTAEDIANNATTKTVRVNRDGTAPSVHVGTPAEGAVVRGPSVNVTGATSDDGGGPVTVEVNGQAATVSGGAFTAQVTAGDGPLTLEAVARDAANNSATDSVHVTVDSAAPVIEVTEPVVRVVNGTSVRVAGTVRDASPVTLTLDGQSVPLSGDTFATDVALGAEGLRVLRLEAVDAAGNRGSTEVALTIDRTAPTLTLIEPAAGAVLGGLPVVARGTVGDAVGPVVVLVNGMPATVVQGGFEARLEGLGEGTLSLSVVARDAAGNTTGAQRTVTLDVSAPLLTLSTPANGTLTGAASVAVAGTVYDVGRAVVTVAGVPAAVTWDDCCSGTFSASAPLAEGDNTLVAEARDPLGRTATASRLVTRDSLAPFVELSAPERVVRGRTGEATATATDASSITSVVFLLDGVEIARLSAPPYVATFQAPASAANGQTLTLVARATDAVGHVGTASRAVRVAGGGAVVGQVLADDTGLPLSGADVRLFVDGQPTAQAVSDERGRYSFAVEADEAVVSVMKAGFTSVLRPMAVQPGVGTVAVDARLMALAAPVVATEAGVTLTAPLRVRVPVAPPAGASASVVVAVEPENAKLSVEALVARRLAKGRNAAGADLSIEVPASAMPAGTELRLTSLSPQGLPGLLPLGWSPLAAFDLRASAALAGPLDLHASGLAQASGVLHLVAFDPSLRAWKLVQPDLPVTNGTVTAVIPGTGAYALVSLDEGALTADAPPVPLALPAPGAVLPSAALVLVPATATAAGVVEPAVLPPAGGTAVGSVTVTSPTALPSGTLVQAEVSETYRLASGQTATEDRRLQDLLLYRQPAPAGASVATTFPITPARSFDPVELTSGTVHLEVKSGREGVRGAAGGSDAVEVTNGDARLSVPSGALPQNTAVQVTAAPVGAWLPATGDVTALAQLEVDLAGAMLLASAELSVSISALVGAIAASDTLLLARVERVQGVPHLMIVALAAVIGERLVSRPYAGLTGVRAGGAYVFVRVAAPVGFVAGTTTTGGAPVRAVLTTSTLPFIGLAGLEGHYIVAARAEANTVTARVPGTSLATSVNATVMAGETATLDLALAGTVTTAGVRPPDGTQGVAPTVQVEIEAPTALDPSTITADAVRLVQLDASGTAVGVVPTRRVLSASRRVLAIVPEHALDYSTTYRLEVNGLADAQQGLVTVPPTSFRAKDFTPPQYDLTRLVITVPDANGLVHVSAEAGTLAPGTRVLILNAGNGIVVTFTADNDGALTGEFPATVEDRLFITITDPQGNLTNVERSTYFDPATGFTAVSAGGGVIAGPGDVELRIPEGALDHAVRLKLAAVPLADVAEADKPADPYATLGGALRVESSEPVTFAKEVDVAFPKPAEAPDSADVVYWIQRRVTTPVPGGTLVVFETLDRAKVEGTKVVTASFPFRGYRDSLTGISALGGPLTGTLDLLFLSWQIPVAVTQPLPGAITGRVLRAKWGSSATAPQYEPVADATVVGKDASGEAFFDNGAPFTRTASDGTYTLLDRHYSGGPFTVTAQSNGQKVTAQGYQVGEAESLNISPLMRGFNVARANVLLPALEPPPPTPQVHVRLFKLVEGERVEITNGLVEADTPLVIGLTPVQVPNQPGLEIRGDGAEVQGQALSVVADPVRQARPSDPTANTYVAQDGTRPDGLYVPANAGTYMLRVTALKLTSPPAPVEVSYAFRVVAAGGGVETDPDHAPAVREAATVPRRATRGVPVTILPQIAFTEPVRGVKSAVALEEVEGGAAIAVRVLGVGPSGPIADVTDADVVTAITLQPLAGLRFDAEYRVRVGVGVTDLDPTPKALAEAYETTFRTFAPEGIPDTNAPLAIAGLAVSGDRAYVAETRHVGGIGASLSVQSGWLSVFDVSDPTEAQLVGRPELIPQPPQDVAYADGVVAVTTFPQTMYELVDTGGTGAGTYSHQIRSSPANVYLYDVEADTPLWVGAVSLTQGLLDGVPQRAVVRGGQVYAASGRKGVQMVPIDAARAAFAPPPAPGELASAAHRAMLRELGMQGTGFGLEHVITIPVLDTLDRPVTVVDLKAAAVPHEGTTRRLVLATAQNDPQHPDIGLAVVDPGAGQVAKRVRVEFEGEVLFSGSAVGYGEVNGKPLAVVGGLATGSAGTQPRVFVVDISPLSTTPAGEPLVLGKIALVANERPSDVLVTPDGLAIVATTGGTAVLISLAQPASPRRVGELAGVGSRIGLTDANILLSTARTFTTGSTDPLRGLHATALQRMAIICRVTPSALVPSETSPAARRPTAAAASTPALLTARDVNISFQVIPAGLAIEGLPQVAILQQAMLIQTLAANASGGTGTAVWPALTPVLTQTAYMAQAMVVVAGGEVLQSPPKRIPLAERPVDVILQALPEETQPEPHELAPGGFVALNDDDDDGNEQPDYRDGSVPSPVPVQDDELVPVTFAFVKEFADQGFFELAAIEGGNRVRLWTDARKSRPIVLPQRWVASPLAASEPMPRMLYVEGVQASTAPGDVRLKLRLERGANETYEDVVRLTVGSVDLDIDSDNNDALGLPQRSDDEDRIEDSPRPGRPGKYVLANVNNDDADDDDIPDFADGYNRDSADPDDDVVSAASEHWTRLVLQVSPGVDLAKALVRFNYSASEPAGVVRQGAVPDYEYKPAPGRLRIWLEDGATRRRAAGVDASPAGHYVPSMVPLTLVQLHVPAASRTVVLYVEGIDKSAAVGAERIAIELDPDGPGPMGFIAKDVVRVTVVKLELLDTADSNKAIVGGSIAWIAGDPAPRMPQLVAKLQPQLDAGLGAEWSLRTRYRDHGRNDEVLVPQAAAGAAQVPVQLGASVPWNIGAAMALLPSELHVFGGSAVLRVQAGAFFEQELQFQIRGKNPSDPVARAFIDNHADARDQWFAYAIARHESRDGNEFYHQFYRVGSTYVSAKEVGKPFWRPTPAGWGVMQRDFTAGPQGRPTIAEIWDWQANVLSGLDKLGSARSQATRWMTALQPNARGLRPVGQRPQSQIDAGGGVYVPSVPVVNGGTPVPVPDETTNGCVFRDGTPRQIEDAVTMKAYNSASRHYVGWDSNSSAWVFIRTNTQGFNYVERVCAEVQP